MNSLSMPWVEIPGWRQNARGDIYSVLRNDRAANHLPNSSDIRIHPAPTLPPARAKLYERVLVESKAYREAINITPENETQRRRLQAVIDRGPTYESIMFYQQDGGFSI